jgi:hypothetical protein
VTQRQADVIRDVAVTFAFLFLVGLLLSGCAAQSTIPPEIRTTTNTVQVPVPVPCFTDDQRPIAPVATPIDPETATTEQLAAAELADAEAWRDYTRAVDALFLQCSSKGIAP